MWNILNMKCINIFLLIKYVPFDREKEQDKTKREIPANSDNCLSSFFGVAFCEPSANIFLENDRCFSHLQIFPPH